MASIRVGDHVLTVDTRPDTDALKNNLPSGVVHDIEKHFADGTQTGDLLATIFVLARAEFRDVSFEDVAAIPWGEVEKFVLDLAQLVEEQENPPAKAAKKAAKSSSTPASSGSPDSSAETSGT